MQKIIGLNGCPGLAEGRDRLPATAFRRIPYQAKLDKQTLFLPVVYLRLQN